jgi:hypothetical protein
VDGGALLNGGPGAPSLSVRVVLDAARICPGECTAVRAVVDRPGAYNYSWTPALPPDAGPHMLCASETTRVAVEVTPEGGELVAKSVVAAATLEVASDCNDAAAVSDDGGVGGAGGSENGSGGHASTEGGAPSASPDAGHAGADADAGPPRTNWPVSEPSCAIHLDSNGGMQVLDMAGDASAYVVGMFKGSLTAGSVTLTSTASVSDGFVVRVDSGCRVVWARSLPGASRTIAYQVATDPDGQVVVAGSFDGYADFGAGLLFDAPYRNVFVVKLDRTDGHVLWNRQYSTTEIPGSNQGFTSLAVAANGDIAFSGFGNGNTDLGGGAIAPSNTSVQMIYVAKLDSTGAYRFASSIPLYGASTALYPDGAMAVAGIAYGASMWGTHQLGAPGSPTDVVARLDAQGAPQDISTRASTLQNWQGAFGTEGIAIAPDGTAYRAEGRNIAADVDGYAIAIRSPGATDPPAGPVLLQYSAPGPGEPSPTLSVNGAGALFAASEYGSTLPVAGRMLTTVGGNDAIVLRVNGAGVVDWSGRYGTPADERDIRVHATPAQGVFICGYDDSPGIFVAEFTPGP